MECVFVFKNGPPHSNWYKVIPSGSDDPDIQESNYRAGFKKYNMTEVTLWNRFSCENSVDVCAKFYENLEKNDNERNAKGWFVMRVSDIYKHLGNAGAKTTKVMVYE